MEHYIKTLTAIGVSIFIYEIYVWLPVMRRGLTNLAARLAPKENRKLLEKQWNADLDSMPNSLAMFVTSLGFFFAAIRLRQASVLAAASSWMTNHVISPSLKLQGRILLGQTRAIRARMRRDKIFLRKIYDDPLCEGEDIVLKAQEAESIVDEAMINVSLAEKLAIGSIKLTKLAHNKDIPLSELPRLGFISKILFRSYGHYCVLNMQLWFGDLRNKFHRLKKR